jgi:3-phosphoshikimate 1-carboxyvinyltransferase
MLLIAPFAPQGLHLSISGGLVSKPYVDITLDVMRQFGIDVSREGYRAFYVPPGLAYRAGNYNVEPDASQASYFWGAAALCGVEVKVVGLKRDSRQGDVGFVDVLARMGCSVKEDGDGLAVIGGDLVGVEVDMGDMPDLVPTLAVIAAFARGQTTIKNVAHLKIKESDRLAAVIAELNKMGIEATESNNNLLVRGGQPRAASIATYNDHRIAMSFALAGLRVRGVRIREESCVQKSFPAFWDVFEELYAS